MTRTAQKARRLKALINLGFDASYLARGRGIIIKCSRCEALVINGVACHEQLCPNQPDQRRQDDAD